MKKSCRKSIRLERRRVLSLQNTRRELKRGAGYSKILNTSIFSARIPIGKSTDCYELQVCLCLSETDSLLGVST
jgi:hypothetical protein